MADSDAEEAGQMSSVLDLNARSPELRTVRAWVNEVLTDLGNDDRDACVLVVNELVSNAFDHAGGPHRVRLRWSSGSCIVRVEVDDASPAAPALGPSQLGSSRGRGLVIVERLSKDWGFDARLESKTVWAEIACCLRRRGALD